MATPHRRGLPDEIVIWEILVRLPPKSLLRCRAVCRDWHRATSNRDFLLVHHDHQPSLPIFVNSRYSKKIGKLIAALDNRSATPDAQLQPIARDDNISLEASCDGLLILSKYHFSADTRFLVYNPAARQHAPFALSRGSKILGMYPHRPSGEYRLLLLRSYVFSTQDKIGCYIYVLGSHQPPRYIGWPGGGSQWLGGDLPARVHDSLHWYESKLVLVFDTSPESFRWMRAPIVPTESDIFEMDDTLGIYSCKRAAELVDIWVLQNYESEVWDLKYRVALPIAEIRGKFQGHDDVRWYVNVASGDGDLLLLVSFDRWLFYVDSNGNLVASFQDFYFSQLRHKQTLVSHTFFTALDGYAANALCFI